MAHSYSLAIQPLLGSVVDAIENVVSGVPESRERSVEDPDAAARRLARKAAGRAAALSGALALPPGVFGMLTVLPDLVAIWRIQAQMVADIAGLYGKEMQLTRSHMLYCLFRHAASQLARDVAVRAGERGRHLGIAARRRHCCEPLAAGRRRGGGRGLCVLRHAAGGEDGGEDAGGNSA